MPYTGIVTSLQQILRNLSTQLENLSPEEAKVLAAYDKALTEQDQPLGTWGLFNLLLSLNSTADDHVIDALADALYRSVPRPRRISEEAILGFFGKECGAAYNALHQALARNSCTLTRKLMAVCLMAEGTDYSPRKIGHDLGDLAMITEMITLLEEDQVDG